MLRERIITIDLDEGNYRILRYKQYDNNQILKIIIQENKEEVDLAFYTAKLFFKLPSGSILEKDTTIENNRIIVSIDSGILSENGRIIADLTLSSSEQLVTAFTMYLDVEETIDRNEAVQSKPEWDLITNTLNNLDTKVDKVEGKSLIANSEIERLANVDNYDDTELKNLINTKSNTTHNHDTQYASKSSEHIHDNKNALDKVTDSKVIEWDNKSDFSGSYEDLTDKPTIPVIDVNKVYVDEQLSNKSDINHTHTELHTHNNKDVLDVITQEKINEWNSKSGFSGDYNDLINKPIIPTLDGYATENYVKNAIADVQLNGGGGTGSIDLSGYATKDELNAKANVSDIPTKTSQLENDSRFLTSVPSEYVTETKLNAKGYLTQHQDISNKVDKINGKSLISNSEIERLANMEDNANNYIHPSTHKASMIVEDNTHRFITDSERVNWNNKVESSQLHEHSNKNVLDGITSDKVANWDKAEENIQSDWNITDTTSDAYIKNKPSIPSRVSELTNDNLYATETYVQNKIAEAQLSNGDVDLSGYATKDELNTKASVDHTHTMSNITDLIIPDVDKAYVDTQLNTKANKSDIPNLDGYALKTEIPTVPTKVSDFTNDSGYLTSIPSEYITETELNEKGFLTEHQDISNKADKSEIPTKTSQLKNDSGFLTQHQDISGKADKSEIPTKTSQLTNDSEYITNTVLDERLANISTNKTIEVVKNTIANGVLTLTTDKYQKTEMLDGTTIKFPKVSSFTEIHLYFDVTTNLSLKFPYCKWEVRPNIEANNTYEIVFTYNTMDWLANVKVYAFDIYGLSCSDEYILDKMYPMPQNHEAIPSGANDAWKYQSRWENQERPTAAEHNCGQSGCPGAVQFQALGAWANIYRVDGTAFTQNTGVEMKNIKVYGWYNGQWEEVQNIPIPGGNFYAESFSGDANSALPDSLKQSVNSKTIILREANKINGENCMYHPFSEVKNFDIKYEYVYTCIDLRKVKWDENGIDDRDATHYCANCGGDWWLAEGLMFDSSWQHNKGVCQPKMVEITKEWRRFSMTTVPQDWSNGFPI